MALVFVNWTFRVFLKRKKKKKKKQCRSGRRPERTHNAEHQGEGERGKDRERGEKDNLDFAVY